MILDEAIKELTEEADSPRYKFDPKRRAGLKLGVEALKRVQQYRIRSYPPIRKPLPGETQE